MKKQIVIGIILVLIAVGLSGCMEENNAPRADFTTSSINTGSFDIRGVQFSDNSSDPDGEIVAWHWDFGDGNTSDEQNPIHNYTSEGYYEVIGYVNDEPISKGPVYNVTLTVTDNKNSKISVTATVWAQPYIPLVHRKLVANFIYTPTENITNQTTIEFNASSSVAFLTEDGTITYLDKNMTYYWDFGDGINVTELNVTTTHQYATAGVYTVNLTAVDEDEYSDYITKDIIILE